MYQSCQSDTKCCDSSHLVLMRLVGVILVLIITAMNSISDMKSAFPALSARFPPLSTIRTPLRDCHAPAWGDCAIVMPTATVVSLHLHRKHVVDLRNDVPICL